MIDIGINGVRCEHIVDIDCLALLPTAVNSSYALFNAHWVPRQVIIDHHIAKLIVQTFAADFCKEKYIQGIRVVLVLLKPFSECHTFFIFDATVHLSNTKPICLQFFSQIE